MKNMLIKELRLSTSPMTYIFMIFVFMTFIPDYPILMSAFFVALGIFQSFHQTRVTNDIVYSALLPIEKGDVVRSKYVMVCFFEIISFIFITVISLIRMLSLNRMEGYAEGHLMNSNFVFLGFVLLIFACFNLFFVNGFFKTAYGINKPYIIFIIIAFILIGAGEALHFIPILSFLNDDPGFGNTVHSSVSTTVQIVVFVVCAVIYALVTYLAYRTSRKRFEKIDL